MRRREFITSLLAAGALSSQRGGTPAAQKINVVLFMTDDHGAWATGYNNCMETPNLDSLKRGGVFFSNAFAATPVCSPSRMTYITGKLPSSHGVQDFLLPEDSAGEKAMPFLDGHLTYTELLQKAGYTLGMTGKWHMGRDEETQRGFSYWATVPGGGGTYKDPGFVHNGKTVDPKGYKTDLQVDFALDFLDSVKTKPFFLMVPFYAPHTPFNYYPQRDAAPYADSKFSCFPDTPMNEAQNSGLAIHHGNRKSQLAYSALISGMDYNIGRVLGKLDAMGVRGNTVVIFTADQGWNAGHHGVWGKGNGTVPYNMYEESIRVPMIWNQPAKLKPATVDAMISSYDLFPTVLDYLGVAAGPPDKRRVGVSYAGFLGRKPPAEWRDRLYFEYSYVRAVRTRTLKYIERTAQFPSELYDLEVDPGEKKNVLKDPAYADRVRSLQSGLHKFFQGIGAPPLADWKTTTKQHLPERFRAIKGPAED